MAMPTICEGRITTRVDAYQPPDFKVLRPYRMPGERCSLGATVGGRWCRHHAPPSEVSKDGA